MKPYGSVTTAGHAHKFGGYGFYEKHYPMNKTSRQYLKRCSRRDRGHLVEAQVEMNQENEFYLGDVVTIDVGIDTWVDDPEYLKYLDQFLDMY